MGHLKTAIYSYIRSLKAKNLAKVFVLFSSIFLGCSKKGEYREVAPMEIQGMLLNGFAVLVDVREKDEMHSGIAKDARWMPMSKIKKQHPDWIAFKQELKDKDKMLVFYCAAGGRAGKVAKDLSKEGYSTGNMGGFKDWVDAKLPVRPCEECGFSESPTLH